MKIKTLFFFKRLGVAKLADNLEDIGEYVRNILTNLHEKETIYKVQEEFRKNFNE
jgi:hypothetical protein